MSQSYAPRDWTLWDERGNTALTFTSFVDIDVRNEGKALSYPVEEGSFANYNKVESPLEIRATLGFQGSELDFEYAIEWLDLYKKDAVLLDVVTPSIVYESMTLESYSYTRKQDSGARMLVVELSLIEVRQVKTQVMTISKPRNPTSTSKENTGQKRPRSILAGG